jgi:sialidase-1
MRYGDKKGRLLRSARVFVEYVNVGTTRDYAYSSAIYSDNGGKTWHASAPFPEDATGENALVELSDGRIYYNPHNGIKVAHCNLVWITQGQHWKEFLPED